MTATGAAPLIFEASISAQMILFAAVQARGAASSRPLRAVLAALAGSLGLALALNSLGALGVASALRELNLLLELACAASIYLYTAHAYAGAPPITHREAIHLLPALLTFLAWKSGLMPNTDPAVLAILATYAGASVIAVWINRDAYRPHQLWSFVLLLSAALALLVVLRGAITYEAQIGVALRDSGGYLALLVVMLALSSTILVLELRYPNLLSAPSSYVKYAASGLGEDEIAAIDARFEGLMRTKRPFLDPEAGLAEIASLLDLQPRQVSQFVNARYGTNVPALLNGWRVEEAARQLRDPTNAKPITTIMYDAGFGSKSAFQREFQRKFGQSPSAYRALHRAGADGA